MAEANIVKAKEVYDTLIKQLDSMEWKYEREDDKFLIRSGVKGDDLPIEFILAMKPKNDIAQLLSKLPFTVPDDKRVDLALAVAIANYGLVDGSFDYDITDGSIIFRLTSSYKESTISGELLEYMIMVSASTIDHYNDKFFMISKGALTLQQFMKDERS